MTLEGSPSAARGTARVLVSLAALAIVWGAALQVRIVLACGIAQACVLVLLWIYPRIAARSVFVTRRMTSRAFEDDDVEVTFGVENRGFLPLVHPEVEDFFVPDKEPRRRTPLPAFLPGRTRALARYQGSCSAKRGTYAIGPAHARVACPLGLFPKDVSLRETAPLLVYPRAVPLPALPAAGQGIPWASSATSRVAGHSTEALSVREYRPGDSLRRVHWPTTARRGKLAVLELELEHARDVTIFLDLDRRTLRGLGRRSTLETSVRIAASAAASYLQQGDRVRLMAHGKELVLVPPGSGERHLALVLEELAHVKPEGELPLEDFLERSAPSLPPGSTAFVIFSSADQEVKKRTESVAALHARGCSVVAVLLAERTFLAVFKEQQKSRDEIVELPVAADALAGEGALVYVVPQVEDLGARFVHPYGGVWRRR
ncbi:DUF58 domain-containing protein [bacterium]|nr:DUF58 domain-containing protein [bacterium]